MSGILDVKSLSVSFGDAEVLEDISFSIDEGESLAIIGPNGSGKTVLLRALLGIIPYEGTVLWKDSVRVGYVPQKIDADLHLPLTAKNILEAKARVMRISASHVSSAAEAVGLGGDALRTPVGHLSGGQFQKMLVAFALLGQPSIVLFDEPTASIDKPGEERIYDLIHRLQERYNLTVVVVSHDLSFVYRYATKVLCLNKQKVCFGAPQETINAKTLEKLYGGPHKYYHHLSHYDI